MKNRIINAGLCDARDLSEESLSGFDNITVNTSMLIVNERSRELLSRYNVMLNAGDIVDLPDGQDITLRSINGRGEIGPGSDGTGVLLAVNGRLTIADGSRDAVNSYCKISVNGKILMPRSYEGQFSNIKVNGRIEYYPDGAFVLKNDTRVDDLFIARASNPLYYCPGDLFFLDADIDAAGLLSKGIRFSAKRIVITQSLVKNLVTLFDEESEIVRVPDGTAYIDDDVELQPRTIRKYGTKLFVDGDISIKDAEALSSLEYLFAEGTVLLDSALEEAFDEIESRYDALKVIDPEIGDLSDRPMVRVGTAVLKKYPKGVIVEDCAKVTVSEDLSPDDIIDKLRIRDCAIVICSKEQEEAVNMVAEDVAMIRVRGEGDEDDSLLGRIGSALGKLSDTQVINASEYKM